MGLAAWGEARSRCPWAGGRCGAAGGLARLLPVSLFLSQRRRRQIIQNRRTDHDFTQHSVIRSPKERQRLVPGWKGSPPEKATTRKGTATDYGVLCDGHGRRRRDSLARLKDGPTGGRQVIGGKDFEPPNSLGTEFRGGCKKLLNCLSQKILKYLSHKSIT